MTASFLTTGLASQRNLPELKNVFDRSRGRFTIKSVLAGLLTALLVLESRFFVRAPQTNFENLLYACILCGAGGLILFAVFAATRAVTVAQTVAELRRTEDR